MTTSETPLTPPTLKTSDFGHGTGDPELIQRRPDAVAGLERIIDGSDLLPASFLVQGASVQRAIARVVLTKPHRPRSHTFPAGTGWATGFMVAPNLFMTNNHVIEDKAFREKVRIQFNYQLNTQGDEDDTTSFLPKLDGFFYTNEALDCTIIELEPNAGECETDDPIRAGDEWGFISIPKGTVTYWENQYFNIVQHPSGRLKEIAIRDSQIDTLFSRVVRYKADTEPGSSGSPVFDNEWNLVALHHAGGDKDFTGKWLNNEGIRIDAIVNDLRAIGTDSEVMTQLGL